MRPRLWIGALLLAFAVFAAADFRPASGQKESEASGPAAKIISLENKWNEAYKQRDVAAMNSLLSNDFLITIEDGSTYSKTGYIAHCGDKSTVVDISEFSDMRVRMHGNTAVLTGQYHEKGVSGGKPYEYHDRMTDVWMLIDGRWQVIASHYSIPVKGASA